MVNVTMSSIGFGVQQFRVCMQWFTCDEKLLLYYILVWPAATQLGMERGEISSRVGENILQGEIC